MHQQIQQASMQQRPMQQQFMGQQPGVTVMTQNPPVHGYKLQPSALAKVKWLSLVQIIMGTSCTLFASILMVSHLRVNYGDFYYAIFGGIYFLVVGCIGLSAVRSNTSSWVASVMVLNILGSAMVILPIAMISDIYMRRRGRDELVFNSLLLVAVIGEMAITIWTAVLCCGALCSCCYSTQRGQVMQYNAMPIEQPPQQVVFPSGNNMAVGASTGQPQGPPSYNYSHASEVSTENQSYHQPPPKHSEEPNKSQDEM